MDLATSRRLAREWSSRAAGRRYAGLERLDPRRLALKLGSERWALLLDETAVGIYPAGPARALRGLPTSLEYLDETLRGFEVSGASAQPGRLSLEGAVREAPLELALLGPPRSFLLAL